jgi:hypothetical protein
VAPSFRFSAFLLIIINYLLEDRDDDSGTVLGGSTIDYLYSNGTVPGREGLSQLGSHWRKKYK